MKEDFLNKYLEKQRSDEESRRVVIQGIWQMLEELGIDRLGLWAYILGDAGIPEYKEKDKKLFSDIEAPDVELGFGKYEDYSDGFIFGVEKSNNTIVFVGYNDEINKVVRFDPIYVINGCNNTDFYNIIAAIRNTVKINTERNIPIDKWTVAHYVNAGEYTVNPYTWKRVKKPEPDLLQQFSGAQDFTEAFKNILKKPELDLSGVNMSNATTLEEFCASSWFEKVVMPSMVASNLVSMNQAFSHCIRIRKIEFNGFETPQLQDLSSAFENCEQLESIDLSGLKPSLNVNISCAFTFCTKLRSIDLSNMSCVFEGPAYGKARTFKGCGKLRTIYMRNCSESSICAIREALKIYPIKVEIITE